MRGRTRRRRSAAGTRPREVLYPWHPWFGRVVRVHEAIRRSSGDILRCSLDAGERIELPSWMFDRAVFSCIGATASPHLDAASLMALKSLLADGNLLLRAYQIEGASSSGEHEWWKLFRFDRIEGLEPSGAAFDGPRQEYKRGDRAMRRGIIAEL